jgi:limonene-1,2-epoxide hydrolase
MHRDLEYVQKFYENNGFHRMVYRVQDDGEAVICENGDRRLKKIMILKFGHV